MKYLFDGINDGDTDFHVVGKDTLVLGLERPLPRFFGGDGQVQQSTVVGNVELKENGGILKTYLGHEAQTCNHADIDAGFEGFYFLGEWVFAGGTVELLGDGGNVIQA